MVALDFKDTAQPCPHTAETSLARFATLVARTVAIGVATRGKLAELDRLGRLSDAELADMGVRRDALSAHVFRDVLDV